VLAGGMFRLGRVRGIERPALAPLLPNGKGYFLLIDCGANVDCRPEYLHQFAMMGSAYMQGMRGVKSPRIGLVNNGAEAEKGCVLTKEAYELLSADHRLNFVGNVEAREITHDSADVIVCDGFVGNIILKFMEGVSGTLLGIIKRELLADTRSKLSALLGKPAFKRVKKQLDYSEVGGAPLLGVRGNVIKAHGSCNGHALACAIKQAVMMIEGDVVGKIEALTICAETPKVSE
ncbi:MAG: phosphate acyltransferase PlsX, partial [Clostridia bacterium]